MDPETGLDENLNIGIIGDKIAALETKRLSGHIEVDGDGLIASPGFIDIHAHEDASPYYFPSRISQCALKTGYTSIVVGNCGMSHTDIRGFFDGIARQRLPIGCHTLIGNVALRHAVGLDNYSKADPAEINRMVSLCRKAFEEGAIGVSFGLQYAPGTSYEEEKALFDVAAGYGLFAAVHMRYDYPEKAMDAVEEVVSLAESTGARLQISHLPANVYGKGNIDKTKERVLRSRADIHCDVYPYNVWATTLQSAVFDEGFDNFNFSVNNLEILTGPYAGQYCTQSLFDELRLSHDDTMTACHNAMPIEDVVAAYSLPFSMVGSDGQLGTSPDGQVKGHPRSVGTPAKFLGEFVREKGLMPLMEGIRKLTLLPSNQCDFSRKGRIQPGCDADITLFNYEEIREQASFEINACVEPPDGIPYVIVGGELHLIRPKRGKDEGLRDSGK
jgi:N-acyl-D-amino-acid deacylase